MIIQRVKIAEDQSKNTSNLNESIQFVNESIQFKRKWVFVLFAVKPSNPNILLLLMTIDYM